MLFEIFGSLLSMKCLLTEPLVQHSFFLGTTHTVQFVQFDPTM